MGSDLMRVPPSVPRLLLVLFLLALAGSSALAAPRLSYLYPTGGQRGTTVTITLAGSELAKLNGFYTTGAGLTVTIKPAGEKPAETRTVEIAIAADAPLGVQQIRFFDETGLSNPRFFRVGQLTELLEKEPNDAPAQATRITLPATMNGRIQQNPDRDGVVFAGKAGQTIVCEIEALRVLGQVGDSWLKGYMEILDAQGNRLADSQGTSDEYYRWDPLIVFTPPADGDYTLFYRDLNWRGEPMAVYRLTVGVVPHAVGLFPLGGKRGAAANVRFAGPNLGSPEATQAVTVPADAPETMNLSFTGPGGMATNARPFQVTNLPETMQTPDAPNRSRETAQAVPFPSIVNGRLEKEAVRNYYKFTLDKAQKVVLEVYSRRIGTPMDAEIALYDAKGGLMQVDDDARGRDCRIERDLGPGEYAVAVRDVDDRGGPAFAYRLSLTPLRPNFRLIATPDAPKIERGGTVSLTVRVERVEGFAEEVVVTITGLPPGVTAAPLTIPKDKPDGPLTLTAAAEAPLGPVRIEVIGSGKAGETTLKNAARTTETYNIQGTAFQRDLLGPILFVAEKPKPVEKQPEKPPAPK